MYHRRFILLAAAAALLCPAAAFASIPTDTLTKPNNVTGQMKAAVKGMTTAKWPGIIVTRGLAAVRRDIAGRGEPGDPTVTWAWRSRPLAGTHKAVAVITIRGFADDSVTGRKLTLAFRRCDAWHLITVHRREICTRASLPIARSASSNSARKQHPPQ